MLLTKDLFVGVDALVAIHVSELALLYAAQEAFPNCTNKAAEQHRKDLNSIVPFLEHELEYTEQCFKGRLREIVGKILIDYEFRDCSTTVTQWYDCETPCND